MIDLSEMNIVQAVNSALDIMLENDPDVIFFGEDAGYFGGVFRTSDGLEVGTVRVKLALSGLICHSPRVESRR